MTLTYPQSWFSNYQYADVKEQNFRDGCLEPERVKKQSLDGRLGDSLAGSPGGPWQAGGPDRTRTCDPALIKRML